MINILKKDFMELRAIEFTCVPSNGSLNNKGECIMDAGIALLVKTRFSNIPKLLGMCIKTYGNHVFPLPGKFFSFPVKHQYFETADITLIKRSAEELVKMIIDMDMHDKVYLPKPGCGNGGLDWERDVEPVLEPIFSKCPNIIVIDKP